MDRHGGAPIERTPANSECIQESRDETKPSTEGFVLQLKFVIGSRRRHPNPGKRFEPTQAAVTHLVTVQEVDTVEQVTPDTNPEVGGVGRPKKPLEAGRPGSDIQWSADDSVPDVEPL